MHDHKDKSSTEFPASKTEIPANDLQPSGGEGRGTSKPCGRAARSTRQESSVPTAFAGACRKTEGEEGGGHRNS